MHSVHPMSAYHVVFSGLDNKMLPVEATALMAEVADMPFGVDLLQLVALAGGNEYEMMQVNALVPSHMCLGVPGGMAWRECREVATQVIR